MKQLVYDRDRGRLGPLAQMILLRFEPREGPNLHAKTGLTLLFAFILLEYVIGPRAELATRLGWPQPEAWLRTLCLLVLGLVVVRLTGVRLRHVGFVPLSQWRPAEGLYIGLVLAATATILLTGRGDAALFGLLNDQTRVASALGLAVPLAWGFYQELIYRGVLQTELTRRFGPLTGVLAANLAFTFGPLHFYHLVSGAPLASIAVMMAAIFAIGLVFGLAFARARNLWVVGIMHGVGNVIASGAF